MWEESFGGHRFVYPPIYLFIYVDSFTTLRFSPYLFKLLWISFITYFSSDSKPRGPSAIAIDGNLLFQWPRLLCPYTCLIPTIIFITTVSFPGSKHVYGIPEHASSFALQNTDSQVANRTNLNCPSNPNNPNNPNNPDNPNYPNYLNFSQICPPLCYLNFVFSFIFKYFLCSLLFSKKNHSGSLSSLQLGRFWVRIEFAHGNDYKGKAFLLNKSLLSLYNQSTMYGSLERQS